MTTTTVLGAVIRDAEKADPRRIMLDLSEVSFVDSTALSLLLEVKARNHGRLSISPSKHESVSALLAMTGTTELLDGD